MREISRRSFGLGALGGIIAMPTLARAAMAATSPTLNFQTIWLNDPEFLGYMLAIDKGFYNGAGIDVNYMPGGPNVIPEGTLLTGKADLALTQMVTTATAIIQKGAPFKAIGVQYQKSPLGVVSLASSQIAGPKDLKGKTVAVPTLCNEIFRAFLKIHDLTGQVKVLPYAFDPTPLINGDVHATVDFATQIPIIVEQKSGKKASYFLFDDHGLPLFMDLLTVKEETIKSRRSDLIKFLRASRLGWVENFKNPEGYAKAYHDTWFKGSGSTVEAETYFNRMQVPLMQGQQGIFHMSDAAIDSNIESLSKIGLKASKAMFDQTLLAEAS